MCGKKFDLFRSMLLPHYCGHFYKEIVQGYENYLTDNNCKLCGATATKRKSRIIHLGVKHELVLPFISKVLKSRDQIEENKEKLRRIFRRWWRRKRMSQDLMTLRTSSSLTSLSLSLKTRNTMKSITGWFRSSR